MHAVQVETQSFTGRRVTLRSDAAFAEVIDRFTAAFPPIDTAVIDGLARDRDERALRAYLEAKAPGATFNTFHSLDQGAPMTALGTPLESRCFLVGNALIAQGLFERERAAGLCAPVRVVVTSTGDGTQIDYDEPTSIFSQFPSLSGSAVPGMLDAKLGALFRAVLGA